MKKLDCEDGKRSQNQVKEKNKYQSFHNLCSASKQYLNYTDYIFNSIHKLSTMLHLAVETFQIVSA
jgi:hypothetical protein